jgi:hypothetical protein
MSKKKQSKDTPQQRIVTKVKVTPPSPQQKMIRVKVRVTPPTVTPVRCRSVILLNDKA